MFYHVIHKINFKKIRRYLLLTGILLIILIIVFETQISPFEEKCIQKQAKTISNRIINQSVLKVLKKLDYNYDDLAKINYAENGDVKAISTNSYNINRVKTKSMLEIQRKLDKEKYYNFTLPIGAFTQLTMLNNSGPDVTINFKLTGSVNCKIKNKFESAGINQTIHRIYLVVIAKIIVMSPTYTNEKVYKTNYEVAQTVIIGNIPTTYANIDK